MKNFTIAFLALATSLTLAFSQDNTPVKRATPKQQINLFYSNCAEGKAAQGLRDILSTNPAVEGENADRVAQGFGELVGPMGKFIDFELLRETKISERTVVIRCIAHFATQPFIQEFTFYNPGEEDWRLVHLRYDANLATMFQDDLKDKKGSE